MTDMQSLLQEQYLKSLAGIEDGQIVTGTVVQLNDDYVFVDVGYKSEGKIPVDEFIELPKLGDKVNVVIVNKEGKGGQVIVSKKKADAKERTEALREAAESRTPVLGKFSKVIKGGFEVVLVRTIRGSALSRRRMSTESRILNPSSERRTTS